jgi:Mechanosensitive ion channel
VKNWTFRNNIRRIAIPIGVAYGSDARQVQAVVLKVAADNPDILKTPGPAVTLDEFAPREREFYALHFHRRYHQNRKRSHRASDGDPCGVRASGHRDSVRADRRHHSENGLAARHRCGICLAGRCATFRKRQPDTFTFCGKVSSWIAQRHSYSSTSSTIANTPGGMARLSAFAVLRLMTRSNLVACSTGRSPGFSPLRTRPV